MEEIWKDVVGYEGLYQVSNLGRIKSLERNWNVTNQYGKEFVSSTKEKILKSTKYNMGYLYVSLSNIKTKNVPVHRLVATAFISNPNNYKIVNHKDGDKLNNCVDNLEWCTQKFNVDHAWRNGLMKPAKGNKSGMFGKKGRNHPISKAVYKCDLNGKILEKYDTVKEASESINVKMSNISSCCHKKQQTSGGYRWRFVDD